MISRLSLVTFFFFGCSIGVGPLCLFWIWGRDDIHWLVGTLVQGHIAWEYHPAHRLSGDGM
ncbi:hypothetical protein BDZ85DRAFT_261891 [Elsinoe ampelina]|uniref:Uncharacterized protein n=1 Tax=Elsinoe ampelina TaxID=302913 RepID=A0A6A6GDX1_9PEZI|nr:hypothetical protein BDZ85DRAFT_261891 [Elsinoe ampelina]